MRRSSNLALWHSPDQRVWSAWGAEELTFTERPEFQSLDPKLPYVRTPQRVVFGNVQWARLRQFIKAEIPICGWRFVRRNSAVTPRASAKLHLQRSGDAGARARFQGDVPQLRDRIRQCAPIPSRTGRSIVRDKATWAAYGLLTVYTFFLALIGPLLPHLRTELDLSYTAGALHTSAFAAGVIVSGLLGEGVIERFGRRRAAQFALAGIGIGFLLVALAPSALVSIGGSAMMGLIGTLILVVVPAVLAERHGEARSLAFTEANILSYLGALAAPLAVWCVVSMASWRTILVPAWAVLIIAVFAIWAVPFPAGRAAPAGDRHGCRRLFGRSGC